MATLTQEKFMRKLENEQCPQCLQGLECAKSLEEDCAVCCMAIENHFTTTCNHTFCLDCCKNWFEKSTTCPMCRTAQYIPEAMAVDFDAASLLLQETELRFWFNSSQVPDLPGLRHLVAAGPELFTAGSADDEAFFSLDWDAEDEGLISDDPEIPDDSYEYTARDGLNDRNPQHEQPTELEGAEARQQPSFFSNELPLIQQPLGQHDYIGYREARNLLTDARRSIEEIDRGLLEAEQRMSDIYRAVPERDLQP